MSRKFLVINEEHSLFDEQRELLRQFGTVEFINTPKDGMNRKQMDSFTADNGIEIGDTLIFTSPIPYLLKKLSSELHYFESFDVSVDGVCLAYRVFVFHNDRGEKKELPNGKIINTVTSTGWEII